MVNPRTSEASDPATAEIRSDNTSILSSEMMQSTFHLLPFAFICNFPLLSNEQYSKKIAGEFTAQEALPSVNQLFPSYFCLLLTLFCKFACNCKTKQIALDHNTFPSDSRLNPKTQEPP